MLVNPSSALQLNCRIGCQGAVLRHVDLLDPASLIKTKLDGCLVVIEMFFFIEVPNWNVIKIELCLISINTIELKNVLPLHALFFNLIRDVSIKTC
jgi:hypothetical protein